MLKLEINGITEREACESILHSLLTKQRVLENQIAEVRDHLRGDNEVRKPVIAPKPTPTAVKKAAPKATPAKKKGALSEEGRLRIAAAQKARWAKKRKLEKAAAKLTPGQRLPLAVDEMEELAAAGD